MWVCLFQGYPMPWFQGKPKRETTIFGVAAHPPSDHRCAITCFCDTKVGLPSSWLLYRVQADSLGITTRSVLSFLLSSAKLPELRHAHRCPFWKIDGPCKWTKPHPNQWNPSILNQTNKKDTYRYAGFTRSQGFHGSARFSARLCCAPRGSSRGGIALRRSRCPPARPAASTSVLAPFLRVPLFWGFITPPPPQIQDHLLWVFELIPGLVARFVHVFYHVVGSLLIKTAVVLKPIPPLNLEGSQLTPS